MTNYPQDADLQGAEAMSDVLRCEIAVIRDGDIDACDKPAVARLRPSNWQIEEFGPCEPYPVCRFHLHRFGENGRAVELTEDVT